jgi:hypothetical protein
MHRGDVPSRLAHDADREIAIQAFMLASGRELVDTEEQADRR